MIIPAVGLERARVASWPRPYTENPYLIRLADALAANGISTISHRYLAALVAAPRGARWLHVHWPEWMLRDESRIRARARARWLFGLLDVARARGLSLAWTAHNLVGHDEPHPDLALDARRALLRRCELVFGHFTAAEADVRALGFQGRFALTPHPGYSDDFPPATARVAARRELGVAPGTLLLLAFGAIEPYKGFDRLASAFKRLAPPDARLHIAGAPASRDAVAALQRIARDDARVVIEPIFASRDRAATLFSAADAAVLAYRAFYTSGTAMLALTYGAPIVGPPLHHLASLADRSFFVPMSSPDELASVLPIVRALGEGVRSDARRFAASQTWSDVGRTAANAFHRAGES